MEQAKEIIRFWFGKLAPSTPDNGRFDMWFGKSGEVDGEIRERYEKTVIRAGQGELDIWMASPETRLALIVVLDQFPRNIHRGQAQAFAFDWKAREAAGSGLEHGHDLVLPIYARLFFYLPFEHSESLDDQKHSLELFGNLLHQAPPELTETLRMVFNYALRHHEIIERFGRFPHRNEALGRASTPEEIEFLKEPNSSF